MHSVRPVTRDGSRARFAPFAESVLACTDFCTLRQMRILPFTDARRELSKLVDAVSKNQEHVVITKQGKPKAVLMSADEFESWEETIEIMSDPKALRAIRRSLRELEAGRAIPYEEVRAKLGL